MQSFSLAGLRRAALRCRSFRAPRRTAASSSGEGEAWQYNMCKRILNARVYELAKETPLQLAPTLSATLGNGNSVYLKREDLQPVFSFKLRGAYNRIAALSEAERARGIVACSAGNHAQGVAMSATALGIDAVIVMPKATPAIKVNAVRKFAGAAVKLHGESYDEAQAEANQLVEAEGRTLIHPFDDPLVIAGQGTIGLEIVKQTTAIPLHAVFVCCGGGGMLAGIATYIKRVRPEVMVVGVEAADAAGMTASLAAGQLVTLDTVGAFADGAAVKTVGSETFRICRELVDEMVTVTTDEICAAIKDGFMDSRVVLEPAGALAIAGAKKWAREHQAHGSNFVVTTSGANMDFDRLRFVSERADSSETLVAVRIPEAPGSFRKLIAQIEPRNVTEFSYRRIDGVSWASIHLAFQGSGDRDVELVLSQMRAAGYQVHDLRENELAKAHLRGLGGGRAAVPHEHLIRFEFPERPGALSHFLDSLNAGWDVSLFSYRNYGSDIGRVLAGLRAPPGQEGELRTFLSNLRGAGYESVVEEAANPVRTEFLVVPPREPCQATREVDLPSSAPRRA